MNTLHLFSRSPLSDTQALEALAWTQTGDTLVLTGEAVWALQPGSAAWKQWSHYLTTRHCLALGEDVQARNLPGEAVTLVDYPALVELCVTHAKVVSWT